MISLLREGKMESYFTFFGSDKHTERQTDRQVDRQTERFGLYLLFHICLILEDGCFATEMEVAVQDVILSQVINKNNFRFFQEGGGIYTPEKKLGCA